ncbi:MAG: penicillin acylase family protein [Solirubrobacterales bacterium]|nr:penicillin acylase family protein [Solirubrobacterales bacterium]
MEGSRARAALGALAALTIASAAGPSASSADPGGGSQRAAAPSQQGSEGKVLRSTVRRTRFGVPHIKAPNIKSLAAGYAYSFAQDNICTIASEYVTVNGQRSKFFGPDANWYFSGNGSVYENVDADVYFRWAKKRRIVEKLLKQPAPIGPKKGVRKGVEGYVAGYNAYLDDVGRGGIGDPACRGEKWVRKISVKDAYRRFFQLGILASSGATIDGIATAEPTSPALAAEGDARRAEMISSGEGLERLQPNAGSNAYGFGEEATRNGKGLVLGNPHFPWDGSERLYQAHLTIPGELDVEGGSLYGVPLILIGWTRGLAWSHTVATAWRFTPFKLQLGEDPYTYVVDGEPKQMRATKVTVPFAGGGEEKRTVYSTKYGPMITDLVGIPLPWTDGSGYALRDVNASNFRYLNHFYDNNYAQTVEQYDRIQRRYQGIPWVNSIAADSRGRAYYSMQGAIPNVPDELAARCNVAEAGFETLGLPILDGSRGDCNWENDPRATAPGTFRPAEVPTLFRDDYVHNGNDSHWLTNPDKRLTGFDRLIGIEDAERSYRTRIGLIQIEQRLAGTDGLPGRGFDRELLERVALGNRQYLGELWRDELVALCDAAPGGMLLGSNGQVDVGEACDVLREWDLRDDLDSAGAPLFRRFATNLLSNFQALPTGLQGEIRPGSESIFTTPYMNSDPVHTPRGLNVANPLVSRALADAVEDLEGASIPVDAGLRGQQFTERGGARIPIHGGPGGLGVFNAISAPWNPEFGFQEVIHGSSFIMAAQFKRGSCPVRADTFVTYSQSNDQSSRHAADFTRAFSRKRWEPAPFCAGEVREATLSKRTLRIDTGRRR